MICNLLLNDLVFFNHQVSIGISGEAPSLEYQLLFVFSYMLGDGSSEDVVVKRAICEKPYRLKINYPRKDLPIVNFCVFLENGMSRLELPKTDDVEFLTKSIFPSSDSHFDEIFSSRSKRVRNIYNQFFFCKQVENFYKGAPHQIIGTTITKCYKAAESGNPIYLTEALTNVEKSFSLLDECVTDWRPRVNAEHLRVSLLCALMHVYVSQRDITGFLNVISQAESIFNNSLFINNYFTASFPLSKLFLSGFFFYKIRENYINASLYSNLLHENFLNCVRDSEKSKIKSILYEDISRIFMSSVYSLKYLDRNFDAHDPEYLEAIAFSFRLGGKSKYRIVDDFIKLIMDLK